MDSLYNPKKAPIAEMNFISPPFNDGSFIANGNIKIQGNKKAAIRCKISKGLNNELNINKIINALLIFLDFMSPMAAKLRSIYSIISAGEVITIHITVYCYATIKFFTKLYITDAAST